MKTIAVFLIAAVCGAEPLRLRVVDESRKPIWARLEVHGADGRMYQPAGAILDPRFRSDKPEPGYRSSFVVRGECTLDVPAGEYRVVAEHGLEYGRVETKVTAPAAATLQVKPWIRMRDRGWWSADFHVHRPVEHIEALALAEDLNLSVVFTMWNKRNLWEGKTLPADPVMRISPDHLATILNAEDERGGGAWMLHQIPEPLPLGVDGRWFPPGIQFVKQARAWRKQIFPWFDLEKLIWWEVPVLMALEPADSLGLLHNHYNQYGMLENEAWGRPRDTTRFPGKEGFSAYTTGLLYRYWNLGFKLPPSAGSATGVLPNPAGYNRIYVPLRKPFTVENWYAAYREGPSFVTNGPVLFFEARPKGKQVAVKVEALAREPIDRIEIVANGEVLRTLASRQAQFTIEAENHSWIAARCYLKTPGTVRMAHSSAVFLAGQWDASADARYFVEWLDALIRDSEADAERRQLLGLYRQAREFYAARIRK